MSEGKVKVKPKYDETEFKRLKEEFKSAWGCVEPYIKRRKIDNTKTAQIERYRQDIVITYNQLLEFIAENYAEESEKYKKKFSELVEINNKKLKIAFQVLNIRYNFTDNNFAQIDVNSLIYEDFETDSESEEDFEDDTSTDNQGKIKIGLHSSIVDQPGTAQLNKSKRSKSFEDLVDDLEKSVREIGENTDEENDITSETQNQAENIQIDEEDINMVQTKESFLKFAASVIGYKYTGDPSNRDSFISDIELVDDVAEAGMKATCVRFIKSRMEGKALEILPEDIPDVKTIIDALKTKIKNESSVVIEGKLAALRLEKGNFTKFAELTEKQAEAYRRSLVNEGISRPKAEQMAVRETVKLCRKVSRNRLVQSVLASSKFETPTEVLATFSIENEAARQENDDSGNFNKNKNNGNKKFDNKKKFNKNNKNDKNKGDKKQFNNYKNNKNGGNSSQGGYKGKKNEHTIRIVSGNQPVPSASGSQDGTEQLFRIP